MAVGLIGGELLSKNLIRTIVQPDNSTVGLDLAFYDKDPGSDPNQPLLFLGVGSRKLGIGKDNPAWQLDISGTATTTDTIILEKLKVGNVELTGANQTFTTTVGTLNFGDADTITAPRMITDSVQIANSLINTLNTDEDLNFTPATGYSVTLNSSMFVTGNLHSTSDIRANGNIILGGDPDDTVSFAAGVSSDLEPSIDLNFDLGDIDPVNFRWATSYIGTSHSSSLTSLSVLRPGVGTTATRPATTDVGVMRFNTTKNSWEGYLTGGWSDFFPASQDNLTKISVSPTAITFKANNVNAHSINDSGVVLTNAEISNLTIGSNTIGSLSNNNIVFDDTNGTGQLEINNIAFKESTITNIASNQNLKFANTSVGYWRIEGAAVKIPAGASDLRPNVLYSVQGMVRFNEDTQILEVFTGNAWQPARGPGENVSPQQAEDLALIWDLILD